MFRHKNRTVINNKIFIFLLCFDECDTYLRKFAVYRQLIKFVKKMSISKLQIIREDLIIKFNSLSLITSSFEYLNVNVVNIFYSFFLKNI